MMRTLLLVFLFILIASCQSKKDDKTYFGGAIINAQSSYVLLCQKGEVIDSIALDHKGHFSHKFDLEKPALFSFKHGYEFQVFYAEPEDSITIRLNTKEFDESLMFGGSNARQNNFLVENFLKNEENNNLIYSYHKIPPYNFEQKIDSIKEERMRKLHQLDKDFKISNTYKEIAQHSINFEVYDIKERYSFVLNKFFPEKVKFLSPTYFDYRSEIDFNNEKIIELIGFQRFLDNYLKNKSIEMCLKNSSVDCFDTGTISNLDQRIHLIDSLFDDDFIRQHYFKRFFQEEVIYSQTKEQLDHTAEHLAKFDLSKPDKSKLQALVNFQESLLVNQSLQNVGVINKRFKKLKLKDVISKNHCIIYSWSLNSESHLNQRMAKIRAIKKTHPDIQLIGINIDFNSPNEWIKALRNYSCNKENEYQIVPENNAMFYRNYLNKIFFVDKNGKIKMSETILTDEEFDLHLETFTTL